MDPITHEQLDIAIGFTSLVLAGTLYALTWAFSRTRAIFAFQAAAYVWTAWGLWWLFGGHSWIAWPSVIGALVLAGMKIVYTALEVERVRQRQ